MKLEGKSELFRALRPSRMATSIDYPSGKVYGQLSPDDPLDEEPEDDDPSPHCSQCPNDPCDCKIADNE
jgi:hypothetical protein